MLTQTKSNLVIHIPGYKIRTLKSFLIPQHLGESHFFSATDDKSSAADDEASLLYGSLSTAEFSHDCEFGIYI